MDVSGMSDRQLISRAESTYARMLTGEGFSPNDPNLFQDYETELACRGYETIAGEEDGDPLIQFVKPAKHSAEKVKKTESPKPRKRRGFPFGIGGIR